MGHEDQGTSFPIPPAESIPGLLESLGLTGKALPGPLFGQKPSSKPEAD
ncbi:MAG: hypothetical protein V4449_01195 [Patescibacteria group bacterium]